jgi:hypothetical protein
MCACMCVCLYVQTYYGRNRFLFFFLRNVLDVVLEDRLFFYVCMYVYIYVFMYMLFSEYVCLKSILHVSYVCSFMQVCVNLCVCIFVSSLYVCVHATCIYSCIYTYTYTSTPTMKIDCKLHMYIYTYICTNVQWRNLFKCAVFFSWIRFRTYCQSHNNWRPFCAFSTVLSTSLLLETRWNHDNWRQLFWDWQYNTYV